MMMKTLKNWMVLTAGLLLSCVMFQSCNDDNHDLNYPTALVTTKTAPDQTFYFQLDDVTTLRPMNMERSPYGGKEVRALVNYNVVEGNAAPFNQLVRVNWIDSILTKSTVPNRFAANDSVYGNDPVEIVNDWVTIAEDGYLTLRFRTYWGGLVPHTVNLLVSQKGDRPYEVEFRHNANGDTMGRPGDALVAFSLKDLPDTKGETVKLKLKWRSMRGMKSAEFKYCTRKATPAPLVREGERDFARNIQ